MQAGCWWGRGLPGRVVALWAALCPALPKGCGLQVALPNSRSFPHLLLAMRHLQLSTGFPTSIQFPLRVAASSQPLGSRMALLEQRLPRTFLVEHLPLSLIPAKHLHVCLA